MEKSEVIQRTINRFWLQVNKSPGLGPKGDCWEWTAGVSTGGYGRIFAFGHTWKAHRLSWWFEHGKIEDGLGVCHSCDNRLCVKPEHLFLGTDQDNVDDRLTKHYDELMGAQRAKSISTIPEEIADKIISMRLGGLKYSEISVAVGIAYGRVRDLCCERQIKKPSQMDLDAMEAASALRKKGAKFVDIASKLGIPASVVYAKAYIFGNDEQMERYRIENREPGTALAGGDDLDPWELPS